MVGVDCLNSIDSNPTLSDPLSDRGWYCILSGVITGLAIDLIYTNLFVHIAYQIAKHVNNKMLADEEDLRIRLLFPFEWMAFMAYFLLAALLVPFNQAITGMLMMNA